MQVVLPQAVPAWARLCITGAASANGVHKKGVGQHAQIIQHGDPAEELHIQTSGVEKCYWNAALVTDSAEA
jgi:hypothetical protein